MRGLLGQKAAPLLVGSLLWLSTPGARAGVLASMDGTSFPISRAMGAIPYSGMRVADENGRVDGKELRPLGDSLCLGGPVSIRLPNQPPCLAERAFTGLPVFLCLFARFYPRARALLRKA